MRQLLIAAIHLYRVGVPKAWRPRCLFRESCSAHVLRIARQDGFRAGLAALRRRYRQCRPGYARFLRPDGEAVYVMADGTVVERDALGVDGKEKGIR